MSELERNLNYHLDNRIESSTGEMAADWHHACVSFVDTTMTDMSAIDSLSASGFVLLGGVWIDDLKKHLAFCYWINSQSDDSSESFREEQYLRACGTLDSRLADPTCKAGPAARAVMLKYLMDTYPRKGTGHAGAELVASKRRRLPEHAQHLAADFVGMFYPNMIIATSAHSDATTRTRATLAVLKALQLGGGSDPIKPEIVSGMEALLAVGLLDADEVSRAWADDPSTIPTF